MVDAVVSFVVQRLGDYIIQEAVFLQGVRNDVQLLKDELEWMRCFIMDAEEKQAEDAMIQKWVSDIRDIAYCTEDVLDSFMLKFDRYRSSDEVRGFFASILSFYCKCKGKVNLYSMGKKIENLRNRISDLSRRRELYLLEDVGKKREGTSYSLDKLKELRRVTSFVVEENVVGFEDDGKILLGKLLDDEPRRFVISILGMGGLGKTTLAKKLYHNNYIKHKFNNRAWVCVSQDYRTEDLLRRIIKSFQIKTSEELEKMSEEDLERCLYESLQGGSYLVVIDDVWHKEAWESLKRAFPDNKDGSRVIITTRIREVAERSDERTHIHELGFLQPDDSWKLFREKAFRNSHVDEELEKLGKEMVDKCGGLPLAIVVLAGLLSTKRPHQWRIVRTNIWRHLRNDSIHISYLLTLSFNDLSYQLKLCFLYLGIFPEDTEIFMEKAIRLLVAEGFIWQDHDHQVMEEVAKSNLDELINRSLIQIENIHRGRVETCRIHDLLRDLAIQKAKELNFIQFYDRIDDRTGSSFVSTCRRLVFYSETCFWFQYCNPDSRSFFLYDRDRDLFKEISTTICTRLRLLRVLHVENYKGKILCDKLPGEIGQLIHLKYLTIRITFIRNVPPSIAKLRRLQTLDLYSYNCQLKLPTEIYKLQGLRHLIGEFEGHLPIENMTNLQTLKFVRYDSWTKIHPGKLLNLRELHISHTYQEQEEFTFDSVALLKSLRVLSVALYGAHSFTSLQPLCQCPRLQDLILDGKIEKLPGDLHILLPNLECLSLRYSELNDDPMPILGKLPNLVNLQLLPLSYHGKRMICTRMAFPRLESLELIELDGLEEWQAEEGALPVLKSLLIEPINTNLRIPERLRSIPVPAKRPMNRTWAPF